MKKYTSPILAVEIFETSDVITASAIDFINETQNAGTAGNVDTVDVDTYFD